MLQVHLTSTQKKNEATNANQNEFRDIIDVLLVWNTP